MSRALIERLDEQRKRAWEQAKALVDTAEAEGRDLTAEENQTWTKLNADMDSCRARMDEITEAQRKAEETEKAFAAVLDKPQERAVKGDDQAVRSFFRGEAGRAFEVRAPKGQPVDFRTLSKLSAGAGANTVKTSFYDRLMMHLIEVSGIMQAGPTVLNTDSGEQIQVPKTTAHSTAALTAEAAAISASDPTFGQVPLDAYKYAVLMQVSNELLTDTSVDLVGYLSMQAGRAVGNAFGVHAITGTGTNQPNGVATAATAGVTGGTGVAGAFTADNLIDLYYSVIAPYRSSPSAGWLMRDATVASVRKLKDTTNQYIWQPGMQSGMPDMLLGKPLYTDPNVAAVAVSAKSVLFGDFSQYFVRMVNGIRFERSDDYAFNTDLVTYRCILRADGDLIDTTGAIKAFVGAAT